MVLGGLEGAHEKRWGDREAEDEGWRGGRAEESQPARQGASLGREKGALSEAGLDLTQNIEEKEGEQGVPMTAFGFTDS